MKKSIVIALVLVLLTAGLLWFFTRPKARKDLVQTLAPSLKSINFQITDIESEHIKLLAHATLENPTPVSMHIDQMEHVFSIEGVEVAHTTNKHAVDIGASDTSSFTLPITLKQDLIGNILKKIRAKGKDSVTYHLKTCLQNDAWSSKKICIENSKQMPLPMIPEIGLADLDLHKLKLTDTQLMASLWVYHTYSFDIKLNHLQYELELAQQHPVKGSIPGIINIPASDTTTIALPVQLNLKELSKSLLILAQKGDDTPYKLKLSANVVSESELFKNGKILLNASGTKGDLDKLAKEKQ